jgi:acetyl-CoA carboxylase biotin carboxylase subunit
LLSHHPSQPQHSSDHQRSGGTDAEAGHQGYGYHLRNADFAERKKRLRVVEPQPETIRLLGDKVSAKRHDQGRRSGSARLEGVESPDEIVKIARGVGFAVIAAGGWSRQRVGTKDCSTR